MSPKGRNPATLALVAVGCVAAFLAGAAVTWLFVGQNSHQPPQQMAATSLPPASEVKAIGRIQPAAGVIRVAGPAGERLVELKVRLHDEVEKGEELAVFESFAVRNAEYEAATQALVDAQTQKSDIIRDAETRRKQLNAERVALKDTFERQREAQSLRIELLKSTLDNARSLLQSLEKLQGSSAVTAREIAAQRLQVEQAEVELQAAELTAEQRAHELRQGEERLRLEEQAVDDGERRAISALALPSLAKQVDIARKGRDRSVVKSPAAGTVIEIAAKVGEAPLGAFLSLADTGKMVVIAEVWETQSRDVNQNQPAEITAGPLLEKPLSGTVKHVARIVRSNEMTSLNPRAPTDGHVFEVEIALDEESSRQAAKLINLQVDVAIQTGAAAVDTTVADNR